MSSSNVDNLKFLLNLAQQEQSRLDKSLELCDYVANQASAYMKTSPEGYFKISSILSDPEAITKEAYLAIYHICEHALKLYSPTPSTLVDLNGYDIAEKFASKYTNPRAILFSDVVNYIHETYGNDDAKKAAFKRIATNLINSFLLFKEDSIKTITGRTVITINVSMDSSRKSFYGQNRLCYNSRDKLRQTFKSFSGFCEWSEQPDIGEKLVAFGQSLTIEREIIPREKISIANGTIEIVTFLTGFQFRLEPRITQELQVFLASYAADRIPSAA